MRHQSALNQQQRGFGSVRHHREQAPKASTRANRSRIAGSSSMTRTMGPSVLCPTQATIGCQRPQLYRRCRLITAIGVMSVFDLHRASIPLVVLFHSERASAGGLAVQEYFCAVAARWKSGRTLKVEFGGRGDSVVDLLLRLIDHPPLVYVHRTPIVPEPAPEVPTARYTVSPGTNRVVKLDTVPSGLTDRPN